MASGNIGAFLVQPPIMDNTRAYEMQGGTFTVPYNGFYRVRFNPSSGTTSRVDIMKDGAIMFRVVATNGMQQYSLVYLEANVTYTYSISDSGQAWVYR